MNKAVDPVVIYQNLDAFKGKQNCVAERLIRPESDLIG